MNPICFNEPLAPWTAARRARRSIRLEVLEDAFRALCRRHEVLIVEGVGGLLVPLSARTTVADVAARFGLPMLVVARPGLGTLNHTLLSIACARQRQLDVRGVVINHAQPSPSAAMARLAWRTNPAILAACTDVPMWGVLPFQRTMPARVVTHGGPWLERHLGRRVLTQVLTRS